MFYSTSRMHAFRDLMNKPREKERTGESMAAKLIGRQCDGRLKEKSSCLPEFAYNFLISIHGFWFVQLARNETEEEKEEEGTNAVTINKLPKFNLANWLQLFIKFHFKSRLISEWKN